jgi:hypothetical protein
VDNKTTKSQTIQIKPGSRKKKLGTPPKGEKAGVCATGAKGAKGTFYIEGSSSVLTVSLS